MSCKGVGSRFSVLVRGTVSKREGLTRSLMLTLLVASTLSASLGCATSESGPTSDQPATAAERDSDEPEQVVQRMAPEPRLATNPAADRPVPARLSAAAVERVDSRPSGPGEPITSKHLEAELNQLEAELGN